MAVDDEDIVRRRDEQRLAEQDAAGRVVEMGGDGFPRPAQGSPRLFCFSRVEAGEGVPTPSSGVYQEMEA